MVTRMRALICAAALVVLLAPAANAINVVPDLNVTAYLGRWYQMYDDLLVEKSFEKGALCVAADYKCVQPRVF